MFQRIDSRKCDILNFQQFQTNCPYIPRMPLFMSNSLNKDMCICMYECLCLFSIFLSQRYKCNFFIISLVVFVVCNNCLSNKVVFFCSCCCYYCYHCCSLLLKKLPPFFLLISGSLPFFLHFSFCQCFFVFISSFIPFAFLNVLCLCYITSYISLSLENKYNKKW